MNTFMWESPFTQPQLDTLRSMGATIIPPISKKLACGDVGQGAMAGVEDVAAACKLAIACSDHFPADA